MTGLGHDWPRPEPSAWQDDATCIGTDTALFFSSAQQDIDTAKAVCAECPVKSQCLNANIYEKEGVWGGLDERERRRLRRKRRAAS